MIGASSLSYVIALVAGQVLNQAPDDTPADGDEFLRVMAEALEPIHDLEFEFVSHLQPAPLTRLKPQQYYGKFWFSQGEQRVRYQVAEEGSETSVVDQSTRGGMLKTLRAGRMGRGTGFIESHSDAGTRGVAMPGRILYLTYFQSVAEPIRNTYRADGWESVNGYRCLKVSFDQLAGRERTLRTVLWIDLVHGGHMRRLDIIENQQVVTTVRDVRLESFPSGGNRKVWLPTSGRVESFSWRTASTGAIMKEPVIVEEIEFRSIRVNLGLALDSLEVRFEDGIVVNNLTNRTSYVQGSKIPASNLSALTPEQAKQVLDEGLEQADQQVTGLRARSGTSASRLRLFGWIGLAALFTVLALIGVYRARVR